MRHDRAEGIGAHPEWWQRLETYWRTPVSMWMPALSGQHCSATLIPCRQPANNNCKKVSDDDVVTPTPRLFKEEWFVLKFQVSAIIHYIITDAVGSFSIIHESGISVFQLFRSLFLQLPKGHPI